MKPTKRAWTHGAAYIPLIVGGTALAGEPDLSHRTGTLVIQTSPGASVTVEQVSHQFWFGTAVASGIFSEDTNPQDREKYLDVLKQNFNSAVHENAMKWYSTERNRGELDYDTADTWLDWCRDNGLQMRGHCVFWGVERFVQKWIKALDDTELRQVLKARATDLVTRYRGRVNEFDVNNEMVHGDLYADRLGDGIRLDMFRWCRQANPDSILYVNDYGILTGNDLAAYEAQIESLLEQGAPVGGIGLQGHFGDTVDPVNVRRVLDSLARFNLPIKITEFDMKTLDEEAKAEGLRTLYRVCFEHPSVNGILMWGFWANAHWLSTRTWSIDGYTALWDSDWKPTPAAEAYRDLVFNEWWTQETGIADENGRLEVPAFLGTHRVVADSTETHVDLLRAGERKSVDLRAEDSR